MEFTLDKVVMVYDKEEGANVPKNVVDVKFKGVKGLKSLKRMQDAIFNAFKSASSGADKNDGKDDKGDVTVEQMISMLDMTGSSANIFGIVMKELEKFAFIADKPLLESIQNELDADDAEGLYRAVLESFLLPKIIQQMNSMKA